jgi:hypothetical protein
MNHYHCTDYLSAQTIISKGYRVRLDEDYFHNGIYEDHVMLQRGMYRMLSEQAKLRVGELGQDRISKIQYHSLVVEWLGAYGGGTIIWLSDDGPDYGYGDTCLDVKLPGDAVLIAKDNLSGGLGCAYWYDVSTIPKHYFSCYNSPQE